MYTMSTRAAQATRGAPELRHQTKAPQGPMHGRRKLDFSAQRFRGKSMFLDLSGYRRIAELEEELRERGALIEKFFNKDVRYLVTNRPREQSKSRTPSTPSPHTPGTAHSTKSGVSQLLSPFTESPGSVEARPKPAPYLTRAQKLVQMSQEKQKNKVKMDIVAMASAWGCRVVYLEELLAELKRLKPLPRKEETRASFGSKQARVRSLRSPFLKVEDLSRAYRPLVHEMRAWPTPDPHCSPKACPFDSPRHTKAVVRQDSPRKGAGPEMGDHTHQEVREKRPGYCECCTVRYEDLQQHLKSSRHQEYAHNDANFSTLDAVIAQGTSFSEFLARVKRKHQQNDKTQRERATSIKKQCKMSPGRNQERRKAPPVISSHKSPQKLPPGSPRKSPAKSLKSPLAQSPIKSPMRPPRKSPRKSPAKSPKSPLAKSPIKSPRKSPTKQVQNDDVSLVSPPTTPVKFPHPPTAKPAATHEKAALPQSPASKIIALPEGITHNTTTSPKYGELRVFPLYTAGDEGDSKIYIPWGLHSNDLVPETPEKIVENHCRSKVVGQSALCNIGTLFEQVTSRAAAEDPAKTPQHSDVKSSPHSTLTPKQLKISSFSSAQVRKSPRLIERELNKTRASVSTRTEAILRFPLPGPDTFTVSYPLTKVMLNATNNCTTPSFVIHSHPPSEHHITPEISLQGVVVPLQLPESPITGLLKPDLSSDTSSSFLGFSPNTVRKALPTTGRKRTLECVNCVTPPTKRRKLDSSISTPPANPPRGLLRLSRLYHRGNTQ